LHDDRATYFLRDEVAGAGARPRKQPRHSSQKIQETWMKLVKTSMIACAVSALIATPVLAQSAPPAKAGTGTVQSKPMQGSATGSGDEEMSAQPGAAGEKTGVKPTKGTRGTVGTTGSAVHKGTADDSTTGGAATGKRY
jgi:hypothetical protein